MFVLKCLRCSNIRVPSHDDLVLRRFSPSNFTRSLADLPKKRVVNDQTAKSEKQQQVKWQFEPFYDMITRRRDEALRSIIISFNHDAESQILPFLKSLEGIKHTLFYSLQGLRKNYVLVEFSTIQGVNSILAEAGSENNQFPQAEGRVLFMKNYEKELPKEKLSIKWNPLQPETNFLLPEMKTCSNLDKIMDTYLKKLEICDLTTRLHFMTCVQIERIFLGAFPKVRAIPFGSSVNGFGRKGSDLDISLLFNHRLTFSRNILKQSQEPLMIRPLQIEKTSKDMLHLFGSMLQVMLPSCSSVFTVPHARVPIIKFKDSDTGCDCDLNLTGSLGICMSEILYTLSSWDARCRSIVFTVRAWARHHGVTTTISPSSKITNFSLLLLVVFFLQTRNVLPTIHEMEELADDRDLIMYQGEPHLFLRHVTPTKIEQWKRRRGRHNNDTPTQLLLDFFNFYGKFPFESKAITISNGKMLNNPTRDALYIVNPLEETLNVARNVRGMNVDLFRQKCKEASSGLSFTQWQSPLEKWTSLFDLEESMIVRKKKQNLIAEIFQDDEESLQRQHK